MNVLITGSTGMIGSSILKLCLQSDKIKEVTTLVRNSKVVEHKKVKCITINNFNTYDNQKKVFQNIDIVFFCLGAYTGKVSKGVLKEITVDYAVNCAKIVKEQSPKARFCLLSGSGADRSEKSISSFAKFKGMAENQISNTQLEFYSFRPGYIYPVEPRKEPNIMYRVMRLIYPLIKLFGNNASIKSSELANAMFNIGLKGAGKDIIENRDIFNYIKH